MSSTHSTPEVLLLPSPTSGETFVSTYNALVEQSVESLRKLLLSCDRRTITTSQASSESQAIVENLSVSISRLVLQTLQNLGREKTPPAQLYIKSDLDSSEKESPSSGKMQIPSHGC